VAGVRSRADGGTWHELVGRMETWPEFVTEDESATRRGVPAVGLTGWEAVVFEVSDDQDCGSDSVLSTAALAP
jgi:hypothetical protein